ncbi:hypothetical protein [Nocardioides sp.]|uniref:hypothetical protein n=1 Tax=Nocardioides sp. TaxID=35761 RepID=UPI0035279E70
MTARAVCTLGLLVAAVSAGPSPRTMVLMAVLAAAAGWWAEGQLPLAAGLVVILVWAEHATGTSAPRLLVAVIGLVVAHVAAHLASSGPADLSPDPTLARRWLTRGVVMAGLASLVWAVLEPAAGWRPTWAWPAGLATAVAVLLAGLLVLRSRGTQPGPSSSDA